jgi:hypothetical protein
MNGTLSNKYHSIHPIPEMTLALPLSTTFTGSFFKHGSATFLPDGV